jgi:acyl carrier protein
MSDLVKKIKEILEVEELDMGIQFGALDEWDSLSVLAILALLDSDYKLNVTQKEIEAFPSIAAFIEYVERNGK